MRVRMVSGRMALGDAKSGRDVDPTLRPDLRLAFRRPGRQMHGAHTTQGIIFADVDDRQRSWFFKFKQRKVMALGESLVNDYVSSRPRVYETMGSNLVIVVKDCTCLYQMISFNPILHVIKG